MKFRRKGGGGYQSLLRSTNVQLMRNADLGWTLFKPSHLPARAQLPHVSPRQFLLSQDGRPGKPGRPCGKEGYVASSAFAHYDWADCLYPSL